MTEADTTTSTTTSPRGLVVGLVLGLPIIGYGVRGALIDAADTNPTELATWIVGSALVCSAKELSDEESA